MFVASKRSIDVIVVVRIGNLSQGFEDWQDPRSTGGTSGLAITSDWLTRPLELKSDARYVVVVEKDGVFNRLVEDRFYDRCKKIRCAECCLLTPGPNDAAGNHLNLSGGTGRDRERDRDGSTRVRQLRCPHISSSNMPNRGFLETPHDTTALSGRPTTTDVHASERS